MTDSFRMTGGADSAVKDLLGTVKHSSARPRKPSKLKPNEAALYENLPPSAKSLVGSLKADLKNGEYEDMAAKIGAWKDEHDADLHEPSVGLSRT